MDGKITFTKKYGYEDDSKINIQVRDLKSRSVFIEVSMNMDNFADAITGRGEVECSFKTNNLENVGKRKETKRISVKMPGKRYCHTQDEREELALEHTPKGWQPSFYFGSKDSFSYSGDDTIMHFDVFRYVDED